MKFQSPRQGSRYPKSKTAPAFIEWGESNNVDITQAIVLDNIRVAVFVCDLERNLVYMNPTAEEFTGCRLANARGKKCFEVICGATSNYNEDCPTDSVLASGIAARHVRCCAVKRSGDKHQVLATIAPLKDSGHITGYVLVLDDIKDRGTVLETLKESETRYRLLAESINAIPWELDIETWRFTYVGPQAVGLLGYSINDWYSENFWVEHLHPDDRDEAVSFCMAATDRGEDHDFEYRMMTADGTEVWLRDIVTVVRDGDAIVGLRGMLIDIGDLKKSEAKYRSLVTDLTQGIVVHRDFRPLFANQASAEILGYNSPDEILSLDSWASTFAPNEWARLTIYMENRRAGKYAPTHYIYQGLHKDGSLIWIDCKVRTVNWEGKPAIQANFIDITERKQVEENFFQLIAAINSEQKQAEENSRRLIAAINALSEYVIFLDANDRIVFCNNKFGELNSTVLETLTPGTLFEDHLKAVLEQGLVPDARGRENEWLHERMERHRHPGRPFETTRHDGIKILMHEQRLPRGETITLGTDISDLKMTEEALRVAKEASETANKAKSEFLANMSHELRTPLNAVLGFAQMLQLDPKNPLSPAQNGHVDSILAGGNHLLELVNDILDMAKIEANQTSFSLEHLSANEVVAECVALIIPIGKPQDIEIIDRLSNRAPSYLRTDRLRLKQILINLLSNAVKYNKDGGKVTIDGRETENGFLHLSVSDTGIGIAEENHGSVFQLFHRFGADSTIARKGTGIGLAVTKLLVERMAGRIGLESEEGVGSTFWIELPLASNEETLVWADTMRVHVDAIDKDHQVLISLLNRTTHRSVDEEELGKVINELIDYAGYHFRREEAVMEVCNYPDLELHRALHRDIAAQVSELADAWRKDHDTERLHWIRKFLRNWLVDHIMNVDTGITKYAKGKEQDIRQALEKLE